MRPSRLYANTRLSHPAAMMELVAQARAYGGHGWTQIFPCKTRDQNHTHVWRTIKANVYRYRTIKRWWINFILTFQGLKRKYIEEWIPRSLHFYTDQHRDQPGLDLFPVNLTSSYFELVILFQVGILKRELKIWILLPANLQNLRHQRNIEQLIHPHVQTVRLYRMG